MKICILGDLHFGVRASLPIFYYHMEIFFDYFFDYLQQHNITTLFQLGDLFDNRKHIHLRTLQEAKRIFFDRLAENNITTHILLGNHDVFFKDSVDISSPELLLKEYPNITVYTKPTTVSIDNTTIDMIPWICDSNERDILQYIKNSKSDLCFGHFDIINFELYRGIPSLTGMSEKVFSRYELVCSGHFHTRSQSNNILYVGTPYEMCWQDYNEIRGFHIFDTESRNLEFIRNSESVFVRLEYNKELLTKSHPSLTNKFVKLVIFNKGDMYKFETFLKKLYNENPYEVKIIEDINQNSDVDLDESLNLENTLSVVGHYIDKSEYTVDKAKLKDLMNSLYLDALNGEVN